MKKRTKEETEKLAQKLKGIMGKGWKVKVWNNLGWHFSVHLDNMIHVYEGFRDGDYKYHVMIGEGSAMLAMLSPETCDCYDKDPRNAVKKAVEAYNKNLQVFIDEQRKVIQPGLDYISS
jgi:hypothetical protein